VAGSRSLSEALRTLGMRAAGSNFRTLKRLIKRYDISTEHLDPNWVLRGDRPNRKIPLEQIMVENSSYGRDKLKRRLYEAELKHRRCELCGQGEEWNGRRMSLILDHVNGVATDNRLENLRIVCPSAMRPSTHTAVAGLGSTCRPVPVCIAAPSSSRGTRRIAIARTCVVPDGRGRESRSRIRARCSDPRPGQLMADLAATNFCAIGRKYGVSDNAVRKSVRRYEAELERAAVSKAAGSAGSADVESGTKPDPDRSPETP
jgi:hypothetical protein